MYLSCSLDSDIEIVATPARKSAWELVKELTKERDDLRSKYEESQQSLALEWEKAKYLPVPSIPEDVLTGMVKCKSCLLGMYHLFILSCGHSYCDVCLSTIFSDDLKNHKREFPQCDPQVAANLFWPIRAVDFTTLSQLSTSNCAENQPREAVRLSAGLLGLIFSVADKAPV
ncbi:hypothetical protein OF83DRAFT_1178691 [Amylostereum chailletii]|nr:hypothetical protein OF83DRAFT_1178691 [Amylostereum chailletii]